MKLAPTALLLLLAFAPGDACRADVLEFLATQIGYQLDDGTNTVSLTWRQTTLNPGGVDLHLAGEKVANVPGAVGFNQVPLEVTAEGPLAVVARVGGAVSAEATLEVRSEQPVGDAVNVTCEPGEEDCEVIIVFTNPGPPGGVYQVMLDATPVAILGGDAGRRREVVRFKQSGEQCITLQSLLETPQGRYQGDPGQVCCQVSCGPPPGRFVRGACDASTNGLTISTAVFGLTFLFSGGRAPPCRAACDANGDQAFDLSDMVYILGYLFLGTPPPVGWSDSNQDGKPDPTCELAPPEDCETPPSVCAG